MKFSLKKVLSSVKTIQRGDNQPCRLDARNASWLTSVVFNQKSVSDKRERTPPLSNNPPSPGIASHMTVACYPVSKVTRVPFNRSRFWLELEASQISKGECKVRRLRSTVPWFLVVRVGSEEDDSWSRWAELFGNHHAPELGKNFSF